MSRSLGGLDVAVECFAEQVCAIVRLRRNAAIFFWQFVAAVTAKLRGQLDAPAARGTVSAGFFLKLTTTSSAEPVRRQCLFSAGAAAEAPGQGRIGGGTAAGWTG